MLRTSLLAFALAVLAAGCAPVPPAQTAAPSALKALPDTPLTGAQRQQWLDRVTWGATDSGDAALQRLGLRAWLARQLHPGQEALPQQARQLIDDLDISRRPMDEIARDLAAQRKAVQEAPSGDEKGRLQQAYQRTLNQLGTEAQKRFVVRALYSPDQLREQMTWFWMNHFNVSLRKADIRAWVGDYEEHAIRPHALGSFRSLLEASLRHPAMLRYLDNASNAAGRINENYARELLELHTMGVGSGYTQADVQEMARILTGVGVSMQPADAPPPRLRRELQGDYVRAGFFEFNPNRHDYGPKSFLGQPMHRRGMAEVEEALDRIVASPATARFIARKLAVFLIADDPPPALVQRTAQAFASSHGDIAATLTALLTAPEAGPFGRKFRDPVHYVLAATRLSVDQRVAADVTPVLGWINRLGQSLYAHETPDGYPQTQSDWDGSGQMAARFEVARQIATRSAVLFRSDPKAPLEQPPHPTLSALASVRERLPQWSQPAQAALAQARNPADFNTYLLSAPEMMFR
ncbi:Protein of uncharacterised function (DUF1800) [Delftia tsuruhatensis]|uniref:DUF1800 domain-containing protein n=1 Tax=Delftia tsuruhatensis TaxID=180282 RepID=UPI001E6DA6C7|nr:DUF1800 domain-containing protein [Delftia tsuruhatensis]CAB5705763.1 Protein of uncharacterised function (DUF1800) [Delftia tsuruhatensis]CAC9693808.1 Protein of uncharacterised function (DUF1800) [Delftia tsuruhatensis]